MTSLLTLFEEIKTDTKAQNINIYFEDLTDVGREKVLQAISNASDSRSVDLDLSDSKLKETILSQLFNTDNPISVATVQGAELKSKLNF